jgi:hypothetical protein
MAQQSARSTRSLATVDLKIMGCKFAITKTNIVLNKTDKTDLDFVLSLLWSWTKRKKFGILDIFRELLVEKGKQNFEILNEIWKKMSKICPYFQIKDN